uniref:FBD domain-containing protein n=1 Tax=Heterorhabditis bacteriophora TaxID=37862 RepID=A0A1I7WHC0_HETBA
MFVMFIRSVFLIISPMHNAATLSLIQYAVQGSLGKDRTVISIKRRMFIGGTLFKANCLRCFVLLLGPLSNTIKWLKVSYCLFSIILIIMKYEEFRGFVHGQKISFISQGTTFLNLLPAPIQQFVLSYARFRTQQPYLSYSMLCKDHLERIVLSSLLREECLLEGHYLRYAGFLSDTIRDLVFYICTVLLMHVPIAKQSRVTEEEGAPIAESDELVARRSTRFDGLLSFSCIKVRRFFKGIRFTVYVICPLTFFCFFLFGMFLDLPFDVQIYILEKVRIVNSSIYHLKHTCVDLTPSEARNLKLLSKRFKHIIETHGQHLTRREIEAIKICEILLKGRIVCRTVSLLFPCSPETLGNALNEFIRVSCASELENIDERGIHFPREFFSIPSVRELTVLNIWGYCEFSDENLLAVNHTILRLGSCDISEDGLRKILQVNMLNSKLMLIFSIVKNLLSCSRFSNVYFIVNQVWKIEHIQEGLLICTREQLIGVTDPFLVIHGDIVHRTSYAAGDASWST